MPRIKRWFPVSHDINSDAEVWAMRRQIGEKSLSIWLEFLSIADRNEGQLPGDLNELIRSIAGRCQATKRTVTAVYQFAISRLWLDSQRTLRVSNYAKYHKTAEQYRVPSEPSEPSEPSLNPKTKDPATPEPSVVASNSSLKTPRFGLKSVAPRGGKKPLDPAIKKWADEIYSRDKKKYHRLIAWITAAQRTYQTEVIAETLRLFVPRATEVVSWWGYLDKILDKTEGLYNARAAEAESARHKEEDRELGAMFRGDWLGQKGR